MCPFCDHKLDTEEKISNHILSYHMTSEEHKDGKNNAKPVNLLKEDSLEMFVCPECDYRFLTKDGLLKQTEIHNKVKSQISVCRECNQCFISDIFKQNMLQKIIGLTLVINLINVICVTKLSK